MSARVLTLALAAGGLLALAGCTSAADGAAPKAQAPAVPAETPAAAGPTTAAPATAESLPAGARCDVGRPGTEGLVLGGTVDCDTVNSVWSRAVADPAFPVHGNRNTITVDGWTCRAHQTRPVQTGYCEDPSTQSRFKVIHT